LNNIRRNDGNKRNAGVNKKCWTIKCLNQFKEKRRGD